MDDRKISKLLSYALRHHPDDLGLKLDLQGWVLVDDVVKALNQRGHEVYRLDLELMNDQATKRRFAFDGDYMRAVSGHSVPVDLGYEPTTPPDVLYHGTATRFLDSILIQGVLRGRRHDVHLSADTKTAYEVGSRHGKPVVLKVDARRMVEDGHLFYVTHHGVWLTAHVPPVYLEETNAR